jgi:hypothetical protein
MFPKKESHYLDVSASYEGETITIRLDGKPFKVKYPKEIWDGLSPEVKDSIVDHISFLSTNHLPMLLGKKGVMYSTRAPAFDSASFKSIINDLPSSAELDGKASIDYLRSYMNLDFVFKEGEAVVWSKGFTPKKRAIISFTSGKESLLTLGLCLEMGIEPILLNVIEPSNTHEYEHRKRLLEKLNKELGIEYYFVYNEPGWFKDPAYMGFEPSTLGYGNQLLYYLFIALPFILKKKAQYMFFGNEFSCDSTLTNGEGFISNFCYDQGAASTMQMDNIMRQLTRGATRVGSMVGPLNEIAVVKVLSDRYPKLAKYQLSCFCEEPETVEHRWCGKCSKCARMYAFIKAVGRDPADVEFGQDLFIMEKSQLFSTFGQGETEGFDRSGLGKNEQELALYLASKREENEFLSEFKKQCRYDNEPNGRRLLKKDYDFFFSAHEYPAMPQDLKVRVMGIFNEVLSKRTGMRAKVSSQIKPPEDALIEAGLPNIIAIPGQRDAIEKAPKVNNAVGR